MGTMVLFKVLGLFLFLLTIQTGRVQAQTASCGSEWGWMNNTAGKDPCKIVESLDSRCLGVPFVLPTIGAGYVYTSPDDTNSQFAICDCNSPMYSLYSACAACQGAGWAKWSEWSKVCGVAHVGVRPDDFYVTTPIPHWAFMNVTVNDTFVPETAKLMGGLPEQRADGPTTTFTPTGSTTFPQIQPSSTTSSSSSESPSVTITEPPKSKTPVGAIAGGAVGGLVVLGLVVFGLFFLRKRGGLKILKIRKSSGTASLFDPEVERPSLGVEEAAVQRPLLYDPTNPSTFSQVHAELERPLLSGSGTQGYIMYDDPYRPPQPRPSPNSNSQRYSEMPEYTNAFTASTHTTHRSAQES